MIATTKEGAGSKGEAGPNLVHFIRKLKSLEPSLVVSQPSYGYPQVKAEIDVINASWNVGGSSNGLAESVGIMVYEGTQSLQYVKNFAQGSSQWEGFPITVSIFTILLELQSNYQLFPLRLTCLQLRFWLGRKVPPELPTS